MDQDAGDGLYEELSVAVEVAREELRGAGDEVFHPRDGGNEDRKHAPLAFRDAGADLLQLLLALLKLTHQGLATPLPRAMALTSRPRSSSSAFLRA
jgi:hypothetical protein